MGTKQVKVSFLVVADDQVSAGANITVGGVQKWTGDLANTNDTIPDENTPDHLPFSVAEFDLEVTDLTRTSGLTTTEDFTFTATRGTLIIKKIETNYVQTSVQSDPPTDPPTWIATPGNATTFNEASLNAQPTWNGEPYLDRYVFDDGQGPLPLYVNELLECSVAVQNYSAA